MFWAPIIMMALGQAVQFIAQNKAASRARRANEAAQQRQLQYRDQASKVIDEALKNWENPNRVEKGVTIEGEILDRHQQALDRADEQGFGEVRPAIQGDVSSAYDDARAKATVRRKADATELARILAKVQAPGRLRNNEGLIFGDTASQLGTIGNFAQGTGRADAQLIQEAGRPSPGAMLFGGLLSGAGQAGVGAGGAATQGSQIPWDQAWWD